MPEKRQLFARRAPASIRDQIGVESEASACCAAAGDGNSVTECHAWGKHDARIAPCTLRSAAAAAFHVDRRDLGVTHRAIWSGNCRPESPTSCTRRGHSGSQSPVVVAAAATNDVKAGMVMNTKFLVSLGSTLAASRLAQGISQLEADDVLRVVGLARRRNYFIENLALVGAGALAGAAVALLLAPASGIETRERMAPPRAGAGCRARRSGGTGPGGPQPRPGRPG